MKKRQLFWIYIFIIAVLILLVGICFSTPSSEASPALAARAGPGFIGAVAQLSRAYWLMPETFGVEGMPYQLIRSRVRFLPALFAGCTSGLSDVSHTHGFAGSNPAPANVGLTSRRCFGDFHLEVKEIAIIKKAADRNGCYGDDFLILLAIRKQENGGLGKEFGVKAVWDTDLDRQAGWAAATVVKNRARWNEAGRPPDFISFLGDRYVPKEDDPEGNINFKKNVRFWFRRFKNEEGQNKA